ncbi:MAG: DUF3108 domain-containing protein [Acidobacteria bacterium]|nr:DUF3108 domain-containing protein [Acidobacteriota bacterium]
MPVPTRWALLAASLGCTPVLAPQDAAQAQAKPVEELQYAVEWRLIRAGTAKLSRIPRSSDGWQAHLNLQSTGLVSKLYRVNDDYRVRFDKGFCVSDTSMKAEEGSRRRETKVIFNPETKKSSYLERDLVKNNIVLNKELDIPVCVHDIVAGLSRLRSIELQPGQTAQFPVSDGKRMVTARVDAQEKENVKTPAGTYRTLRCEIFLFNDVLYSRKGRLFVWLTDDEKKVPVQVRAKLNFPVGTISFQLEKTGPS